MFTFFVGILFQYYIIERCRTSIYYHMYTNTCANEEAKELSQFISCLTDKIYVYDIFIYIYPYGMHVLQQIQHAQMFFFPMYNRW